MPFEPQVVAAEALLTTTVFDVERLELREHDASFTREIVRHRGSVAVLPVDGDDVVLVRQWRAPVGDAILEIVAGTRDVEGESPQQTAARELQEEAGLRAERIEPLCTVLNSPGWSDQRTQIFVATGLSEVPRSPGGPEEAAIEVVRMPLGDAVALARSGDACDASTAVALLAYAMARQT
jgi:ADP-ribose pyrophosphatase